MGEAAARALVLAAVCSGCLSAPPDGGAQADAAIGPHDAALAASDASPCAVITEDDFASAEVQAGSWAIYADSGGTVEPDAEAGVVTLSAPETTSYAELESKTAFGMSNTVLEARFSVETTGIGEMFFSMQVDDLNTLEFFVFEGQLYAQYEVNDEDTFVCKSCPIYDAGSTVSVRITADDSSAVLEWAPDGGEYVQLGTSELVTGEVYLQVHTYAPDGTSTATLILDDVSWRDCSG